MPRILADFPDEDIKWLDRIAEEQGKSRAAVLRDAVTAFRGKAASNGIEQYFGLWASDDDGDVADGKCTP